MDTENVAPSETGSPDRPARSKSQYRPPFEMKAVYRYLSEIDKSTLKNVQFLGAFVKLRKATISFFMAVRVEQIVSYWTDFHEILCLGIFRKTAEKSEVSLKCNKNSGRVT